MDKKIVFLDIDGVLNDDYTTEMMSGYVFVDNDKVANLAKIIHATDAHIILSSDWRYAAGKEQIDALVTKLGEYGLKIEGGTPRMDDQPRYREIDAWLQAHPEVTKFVVLDDRRDAALRQWNFIRTNYEYGLTKYHAEAAIEMLNK